MRRRPVGGADYGRGMADKLTRQAASEALPTWRFLLQRMHLTVRAPDVATAFDFVARVAATVAPLGRQPDLDVRGDVVHLAVSTEPAGGVTVDDIAVGDAVDAVVAEMGLTSTPGSLTVVEIAIDAIDIDAVRPFWDAVLGWDVIARNDVQDPLRLGPAVWFQQMDEPRPQRNRIHLDVTVAHDEAAGRIERALAAGGRLVSDDRAPAFWILADAEGNEACLCTWQGRDPVPGA
ncbi:MAG: 4a-hydroxytetrahydrobiopterin dehydratase [Humibacillus sp.]|nr:4a-hydroxytetrahydrobiopterin dehydratase [Humibacillus sp.]